MHPAPHAYNSDLVETERLRNPKAVMRKSEEHILWFDLRT